LLAQAFDVFLHDVLATHTFAPCHGGLLDRRKTPAPRPGARVADVCASTRSLQRRAPNVHPGEEEIMARCETCGNDYDKTLEIKQNGSFHTFDSFECAIQALAPVCGQCGCRVVGHGVEAGGAIYCGA